MLTRCLLAVLLLAAPTSVSQAAQPGTYAVVPCALVPVAGGLATMASLDAGNDLGVAFAGIFGATAGFGALGCGAALGFGLSKAGGPGHKLALPTIALWTASGIAFAGVWSHAFGLLGRQECCFNNALAGTASVAGTALAVAGWTTAVVGLRRNQQQGSISLMPVLTRRQTGLALSGQF